mmetsp:Transcript_5632/g.9250  ORF Transcript_5632/g.9250 Transcript_5632/m.9250 type:complete len:339 (-) Transcript_5632:113-1129(-)
MEEEESSTNTGSIKTITVSDESYDVQLLSSAVDVIKKVGGSTNPKYSGEQEYLCKCDAAFGEGTSICNKFQAAFGSHQYRITKRSDGCSDVVWMCANCQQKVGIIDGDDRHTLIDDARGPSAIVYLPLGVDSITIPVLLCNGSCVDFAAELISKGHVLVYQASPPSPNEMERIASTLFEVEREGTRRGSKHYSKKDGSEEQILEALMSCPNVEAHFDKIKYADGEEFVHVLPVLYDEGNRANKKISFLSHVDRRYPGKPPIRSNWNIDSEPVDVNELGKIMRFQHRVTGWWIDIHCVNGTVVEQSHFASGIGGGGVIEHAIFNAESKITITFDHGQLC